MEYASRSRAGILFELHQGLVDRGADLSWLSQVGSSRSNRRLLPDSC